MISSPKTPAPAATLGNMDARKIATNEQSIPLPYFSGRAWLPLNWAQTRIYKPRTQAITSKVGKSKQVTGYDYYGSLIGVLACCRLDYLQEIEVAGAKVWTGDLARDVDHPHHSGDIVVPGVGTFRVYWGTSDQPVDDLILSFDAGLGLGYVEVIVDGVPKREYHPRYLDQPFLVAKDLKFGQNNATPPTIRVLAERAAYFTGLDEERRREGANPVTTIAEVIGNDFYGLGMPEVIHVASAAATADAVRRDMAVPIEGAPDYIAAMGYISPIVERQQSAQTFFAQIMEYYDGWVRPIDGQLYFGRFPHDGVTPVGLPELSYHDFVAGKRPRFEPADDDELITEVNVVHRDRDDNMEKTATPVPNPAARRRLGMKNPRPLQRPFVITKYQAREQGNQYARHYSRDEEECSATIRREKVVGLHAGDRFVLVDAPSASSQVVRIKSRVDPADGGEVEFSMVLERGLAPIAYVAPPNPRPTLPDPQLVAIAHARAFQLPTRFADYGPDPAVVLLAERPGAHVAGYTAHFSVAGLTYDQIVQDGRWALRAVLAIGVTAAATQFTINASGFELPHLAPQSDAARDDNTLLAFIGFEICSIGNVVALGGGQYQVHVLRGRCGSAADAHALNAQIFIIPRSELEVLQHAHFPRGIATRYFKLASYTRTEEQELADALEVPLQFDDTNVESPAPLTVTPIAQGLFLAWKLPVPPEDTTIIATDIWERDSGAIPVPGVDSPTWSFRGNGFSRTGLVAGTTKHYWVQNRDTTGNRSVLVGPVSGIAAAAPTGPQGPQGPQGPEGEDGGPGPGIVYVGEYNAAFAYFHTDTRKDIVKHGGLYYPANNLAKNGTATWGTPGSSSDWGAAFTSFRAVATALLLAEDATILKTLVMGDGTSGAGIIRSATANSYGVGAGFWLGYDGVTCKARFGDPAGSFLGFDGTKVTARFGTGANQAYFDGTTFLYGNPAGSRFIAQMSGAHVNCGAIGAGEFYFGTDANGGFFYIKSTGGPQMLGFDVGSGKLKFFGDANAAWYSPAIGRLKNDGSVEAGTKLVSGGDAEIGGNVIASGDIRLGNGVNRWLYDGAGNRILQQRYSAAADPGVAVDEASAIARVNWCADVLLHHGLGA